MSDLRIFSYLPNPRVWKATIAGRLCGVEVEVRGASPKELGSWLWDFDAHPLSEAERAAAGDTRIGSVGFKGSALHKADRFLQAHPFGTVPAAFSPDGEVGIFESNSIMRAVARLGEKKFPLYGRNAYEASRIDSFLDASLVFARDAQIYLLALAAREVSTETYSRAREGFATYAAGIEQALSPGRAFIVGENVTLADICFASELSLFMNERVRGDLLRQQGLEPILAPILDASPDTGYPRAMAHFSKLRKHPAFAPDVDPYLAKLEAASQRREQ